ncbi:MAG: aldo/keto reductase [Anaerolineae bacterium]|nr:aldo/keto reductase [Anaerolineae bacterium]
MTDRLAMPLVSIPPIEKKLNPLALGSSVFGTNQWAGERAAELLTAMEAALQNGVTHFDTASSYGDGGPERLIGQFLTGKREQVFLASKAHVDEPDAHAALESALQLAAIAGRINYFGGLPKDRPTIQSDSNLIHYKELHVTGTTACSTGDCWQAAHIVNGGRVNLAHIVSGRFSLRRVKEAFAVAENRESLKIVIEP